MCQGIIIFAFCLEAALILHGTYLFIPALLVTILNVATFIPTFLAKEKPLRPTIIGRLYTVSWVCGIILAILSVFRLRYPGFLQ